MDYVAGKRFHHKILIMNKKVYYVEFFNYKTYQLEWYRFEDKVKTFSTKRVERIIIKLCDGVYETIKSGKVGDIVPPEEMTWIMLQAEEYDES